MTKAEREALREQLQAQLRGILVAELGPDIARQKLALATRHFRNDKVTITEALLFLLGEDENDDQG